MAKKTSKISFSKSRLTKENGNYIITEYSKDDTNEYNFSAILDSHLDIDGLYINLGFDDEIPPVDGD